MTLRPCSTPPGDLQAPPSCVRTSNPNTHPAPFRTVGQVTCTTRCNEMTRQVFVDTSVWLLHTHTLRSAGTGHSVRSRRRLKPETELTTEGASERQRNRKRRHVERVVSADVQRPRAGGVEADEPWRGHALRPLLPPGLGVRPHPPAPPRLPDVGVVRP